MLDRNISRTNIFHFGFGHNHKSIINLLCMENEKSPYESDRHAIADSTVNRE